MPSVIEPGRRIKATRAMLFATVVGMLGASAGAAECPFLGRESAARALMGMPGAPSVTDEQPPPQSAGAQRMRTCYFKLDNDGIGQLSVTVFDFDSAANATKMFEGQRKRAAEGTRPLKGLGQAAFMLAAGGGRWSDSTWVLSDKKVLRVNHVFGTKAKAAIARDPDGSVIGTHELAREALRRL